MEKIITYIYIHLYIYTFACNIIIQLKKRRKKTISRLISRFGRNERNSLRVSFKLDTHSYDRSLWLAASGKLDHSKYRGDCSRSGGSSQFEIYCPKMASLFHGLTGFRARNWQEIALDVAHTMIQIS